MKFWVYKLTFSTEVHIGDGLLTDSGYTMHADTFFSALCIEALKIYGEEGITNLKEWVNEDKLVLSDGFPYINDVLYLPKPLNPQYMDKYNISKKTSSERKAYKKLKYLPVDIWWKKDTALDIENELIQLKQIGESTLHIRASIQGLPETEPYGVGGFVFSENGGIYFIVGIEEEYETVFDNILDSLQYTGIGGKISTGMGKFQWEKYTIKDKMKKRLCYGKQSKENKNLMTLSVSLPQKQDELVLEDSYYSVIKRSGFVASQSYTIRQKDMTGFTKKKNLYVIQAGSCMTHGYCGNIIDVSDGGTHEVLRYAKPLFWRVEDYE